MTKNILRTVNGDVTSDTLGLILPHEHLFVDLRGPQVDGYGQGEPEAVARLLRPALQAAEAAGVTALVECSTIGVGRNVRVLRHLAQVTPIRIIAPTGVYREAYIPAELRDLSVAALADLWVKELTEGIEGTGVCAGFIKIAMSDNGPTPLEERSLKAAALASRRTGAVIASHTIGGAAARREMDILEAAGLDLGRFIWVHAHTEPDMTVHLEAARRGAWVEFDAIGAANWFPEQSRLVDFTVNLLDAGFGGQILLSHDAGWYEPGQPEGRPADGVRGYTALVDEFLPALRARGADESVVRRLTHDNPARAFSL
ncbi:MAG: esterase [Chloroflexi bacterium]|nr:esterase [Chloroflexota bacterium]